MYCKSFLFLSLNLIILQLTLYLQGQLTLYLQGQLTLYLQGQLTLYLQGQLTLYLQWDPKGAPASVGLRKQLS